MATENVKVISIDTGSAKTSVKELRKELKDLKDVLVSAEQGTDEYNEALQRAANIQHELREATRLINSNAQDFGQIVTNTTSVLGGLTAGFQAAQATMNLFGVQSEDVIKSLQRMQSLMALTQALPALDKAYKGFVNLRNVIALATGATSAFGKALISTGIGAAVAALGLLIANWDKLRDAISGVNRELVEQEKLKYSERLEKENKELERQENLYRRIAKIQGKSNLEIENELLDRANKRLKEYTDRINDLIDEATQYTSILNDATIYGWWEKEEKAAQEAAKKAAKQRIAEINAIMATLSEPTQKQREKVKELTNAVEEAREIEEAYQEAAKRKELLEQLEKEKKLRIELLSIQQEAQATLERLMKKQVKEVPEPEPIIELPEPEDDFLKIYEYYEKVREIIEGLRAAFPDLEQRYAEEVEALEYALKAKLISQEEYNRLSAELNKEHLDEQKRTAVAEAQVWMTALGNLGSIFSSIADTIDRDSEEGEKRYKALMYTSVLVSTLAGVGGAIASAFMPVNASMTIWGQIAVAASTAASVMASGIAQLVQIKNANSNSSLGSTSSSAINSITAPVQYTQDVQGASLEGAIKDTRVYVLESDISGTTKKVNVAEKEARF